MVIGYRLCMVDERLHTERALPGSELVEQGLADLEAGEVTIQSLLVSIGAPRLRRLGFDLPPTLEDADERLYLLLARDDPDAAHGRHHALVRRELARARGREIDTAGDGFLASFDGPARAIRCAAAIRDSVRELGVEIRAGLHTGECELLDGKVAGIAVHTGARVASCAGPGEVLVSSTVKDLVAGSGIEFEERGVHELKGIPGEWRLYAAA